MKAVLETLYKWCGALHRYIQRGSWNRTFTRLVQVKFVGGYVIVVRRGGITVRYDYLYYTGDGTSAQIENVNATNVSRIIRIGSVGCRSLIVDGEVLV